MPGTEEGLGAECGKRGDRPRPLCLADSHSCKRSEDAKEDVATQQMGRAQGRPRSRRPSEPKAPTSQMRKLGCGMLKGLAQCHQAETGKKDDKTLCEDRQDP